MSVQKLVKEMEDLGMYVFANGAPSEALLKDAIDAEKEFRKKYGDIVERNFAAREKNLKQNQEQEQKQKHENVA